jgi:hypothetical protein
MKRYISLVSKRSIATVGAALLVGSAQHPAWAADALDIRLPSLAQLDPPTAPIDPASPPAQTPAGGFIGTLDSIIASLDAYAASARATQPNWSTPLTTTTGLLESEREALAKPAGVLHSVFLYVLICRRQSTADA